MLMAVYFFEPILLLSNVFTSTGILENSSGSSRNMIDAWEKLIFLVKRFIPFSSIQFKDQNSGKRLVCLYPNIIRFNNQCIDKAHQQKRAYIFKGDKKYKSKVH